MKVIIVGTGIAGLSLGYFLKQAGVEVVFFDQANLTGGSSAKAAGLVTLQLRRPLDIQAVRESLAFYRLVEEKSQGIFRYRKTGLLWLARSPEAVTLLYEAYRVQRDLEVPVEYEDGPVPAAPPGLLGILGSTYCPADGYVNPYAVGYALYTYFRHTGTPVRLLEKVTGLKTRNGRVIGVIVNGRESVEADRVVLCTGVWTAKRLKEWLGLPLPLVPYRAQAASLQSSTLKGPALYDLDTGIYLVPEQAGQWIVGDGTQLVPQDPDGYKEGPDPEFYDHVSEPLSTFMPMVATEARLGHGWAGLLAGTPDQSPLLGPYPGVDGLVIAAGSNGSGIMRAPGMMRWLSEWTISEKPLPPQVRVDRFSDLAMTFPLRPGFPAIQKTPPPDE